MKIVKPLDAMGREIKVGDHIVYATYTRESGLGKGVVVGLKPYDEKVLEKNPLYDPNLPDTRYFRHHQRNAPGYVENDSYITVLEQHFKIQFERDSTHWVSDDGTGKSGYVPRKERKTLDKPRRFAVVEPV